MSYRLDQLPVVLSRRVKIACSAQAFYDFFKNFENYGKWFPGIIYMKSADDLPHGTVGKQYDELAQAPFGKEEKITVQLVAAEVNRHLAIEANLEPFLPRFDYTIHRISDQMVEFEWTCRTRGRSFKAMLARPVFRKIVGGRADRAMIQLKALLEKDSDKLMSAALIRRYGSASDVNYVSDEAFKPIPKSDEVLIRVIAASINPIDVARRAGYGAKGFAMRGAANWPIVLGNDFAGEVVALGKNVSKLKIGEKVFGAKPPSSEGTFAQFTSVKADECIALPALTPMQEAAAYPYAFITAWNALVVNAKLSPSNASGKRILVQGGAGAVGAMAAQLATAWGAHVEVTCSARDCDWILSRGIARAHDYAQPNALAKLKDFDIVLCAGDATQEEQLIAALKRDADAIYLTVLHPTLQMIDELGVLKGLLKSKKTLKALNKRLKLLRQRAAWVIYKSNREALETLAELLSQRKLSLRIDSVYPLDQIATAQEKLEKKLARGKVLIDLTM
jgi:reticulon-4-interacting protein 1, mitochondrial